MNPGLSYVPEDWNIRFHDWLAKQKWLETETNRTICICGATFFDPGSWTAGEFHLLLKHYPESSPGRKGGALEVQPKGGGGKNRDHQEKEHE